MNDKLLLNKKINIRDQYVDFLYFIHPWFELVKDLNDYCNPNPTGIIYTGKYSDDVKRSIERITNKWIIVNNSNYDYDLTTNDGLVKNLLPLNYPSIKNSKEESIAILHNMGYDVLLEKIKVCLLDGSKLTSDNTADNSVYTLFASILATSGILYEVFFTTVTDNNVNVITSSILTMLNRVQSLNVRGVSTQYANLIIQSNKRYGKRIKSAIYRFVKSKANKVISLYNLLTDLNKAR